jgi:hypothetical protein
MFNDNQRYNQPRSLLGRPDTCSVIVMDYICSIIRPDHANHWIQVQAEPTIPNHSFVMFVMTVVPNSTPDKR